MKKIIAMLMVFAMLAAFAACAETDSNNSDAESSAATSETSAESSEAVSSEEASAESTEDSSDTSEPETNVMTHDEFMAAAIDSEVVVETYIQATQGWWTNDEGVGVTTVYCQGEDGAYFLYEIGCAEEDAEKLVPGAKIRVTGYKAEWEGEVEIVDGNIEFIESEESYIAEAADVTELLGTEELISRQNELVAFNGMTVEAITYKNDEPGDDIYVTLGYNGESYDFCVEVYLTDAESEVYKTVGTLEVGNVVNVEGFLYWYQGVNTHITAISLAE